MFNIIHSLLVGEDVKRFIAHPQGFRCYWCETKTDGIKERGEIQYTSYMPDFVPMTKDELGLQVDLIQNKVLKELLSEVKQ